MNKVFDLNVILLPNRFLKVKYILEICVNHFRCLLVSDAACYDDVQDDTDAPNVGQWGHLRCVVLDLWSHKGAIHSANFFHKGYTARAVDQLHDGDVLEDEGDWLAA